MILTYVIFNENYVELCEKFNGFELLQCIGIVSERKICYGNIYLHIYALHGNIESENRYTKQAKRTCIAPRRINYFRKDI